MTRWIIALALLVHGIGHIVFFFAAFTPVPMDFVDAPWLLPGAYTVDSPVGKAICLALAGGHDRIYRRRARAAGKAVVVAGAGRGRRRHLTRRHPALVEHDHAQHTLLGDGRRCRRHRGLWVPLAHPGDRGADVTWLPADFRQVETADTAQRIQPRFAHDNHKLVGLNVVQTASARQHGNPFACLPFK